MMIVNQGYPSEKGSTPVSRADRKVSLTEVSQKSGLGSSRIENEKRACILGTLQGEIQAAMTTSHSESRTTHRP
jgi:hypothetical protein